MAQTHVHVQHAGTVAVGGSNLGCRRMAGYCLDVKSIKGRGRQVEYTVYPLTTLTLTIGGNLHPHRSRGSRVKYKVSLSASSRVKSIKSIKSSGVQPQRYCIRSPCQGFMRQVDQVDQGQAIHPWPDSSSRSSRSRRQRPPATGRVWILVSSRSSRSSPTWRSVFLSSRSSRV
jgi:hypothetical protein